MNRSELLKSKQLELTQIKKHNHLIDLHIKELNSQKKDTAKVEAEIINLSMQFKVGDFVVLPDNCIAEIKEIVKDKYKVHISETRFKGATYTESIIDEEAIVCHVMDLIIKFPHYSHKRQGWRRNNEQTRNN